MSADLRTLLRESAPVPREPADVDALFERVDRRRVGRRVARVAGLAVALAAAVVVVQLIGPEAVTPVIEQDSSQGCAELADGERIVDEAQVDLDGDGRTDRVLLVRKRFGDHLVLCLAEGTRRLQDLPDLQQRADRVEAVDLAGTPGVALINAPDISRPEYQQYYLAVLRSDGADSSWLSTFQIVWEVPYEERLGIGAGGGGYPLVDHRGAGTSVETFGCRPTDEGAGVEIIELRIEQFDDEIAIGGDAFEYVGDDLAVSYVVRQVEPDWGGMTPPSERTAVPIEGDTVQPAELLAGLDATWLCRPAPFIDHGPRPPLECREPAEGEQVVDDVDLDGDGTDDQVTLHRDGVILACLADGSVTAVAAYPTPPGVEDNGTSQSIAAADLGGSDGIIVTLAPGPDVSFHTQNYLLRVDRGRLGIVGDSSVTAFGLPDVQGLTHYGEGWDFPTGDQQGTAGSFGLLGCRPSERPLADFDAVTLIHSENGRLYAEMVSVTGLEVIYANSPSESIPGLPDTATREELDQILLDMGFTPGCRPAP